MGTVPNALIAATAKHWAARLLTRDRRAAAAYDKVGARCEIVG